MKKQPAFISYIEKEHVLKIVNKYTEFGTFLRHRALRRINYWECIEKGISALR